MEKEEVGPTRKARKSAEPPGRKKPNAKMAQSSQGSAASPPAEADITAAADPIERVRGKSVILRSLVGWKWPHSRRPYLSQNVQSACAGAYERAVTRRIDSKERPNSRVIVDAADMMAAALVVGRIVPSGWSRRMEAALRNVGASPDRLLSAATLKRWKQNPAPPRAELVDGVLRWDAVAVLDRASALRRRTNQRDESIGLRHICFAAIATAEGQQALQDLGLLAGGLPQLVSTLIEHTDPEAMKRDGDDPEQWNAIFAEAREQRLLIETRRLQSGFSPDVVANDGDAATGGQTSDPLGTRSDAVALADLILLETAKPPLAIGLLGSWGSGKSTLMWRLRQEIQRQIEAAQSQTEPADPAGDTRSVRNVAQLTFNAWSFADSTNLWASLTAEIFEQLKAGGSDAMRGQRGESLVEEVAGKLAVHNQQASSGSSAASLQTELSNLESQARNKSLEAEATQLHAVTVAQLITGDASTFENRLRKALPGDEDAIAMDAHGRGLGRAWWLAKRMYPGWLRAALTAAFALAAGVAVVIFVPNLGETWRVIATATPLLAALALVGKPIFTAVGTASRYDELVHRRKAKLAQEATELQGQVEAKKAELGRAREEEERRATTVATLAETKGNPARLLQYLLSESADIQSIKAQVGLMATVRRCFETLDELIKRHIRLARQGAAKGAKKQDKGHGKTPPIERIILYIDDLDRCSAEQVVKVLEAVHLLLAFECFVVVVAIDARWLHRSLLISHPQFKRVSEKKQAGGVEGGDEAATDGGLPSPSDYLEKIFQIPFWVRALRPPAGAAGGALRASPYTRYLDTLLGRRQAALGEGDERDEHKRREGTQEGEAEVLVPVPPEAPETFGDDLRTRRDRVTLSTAERDLLDALGPLAARSPRAIKRLVNIYRLLKAGVSQAQAPAFEGKGSAEIASFASILFVLALDAGLPAETVTEIRSSLMNLTTWQSLEKPEALYFYEAMLAKNEEIANPHLRTLVETLTKVDATSGFVAGLQALHSVAGTAPAHDDIERAFALTQRYSFRSI